MKRRRWSVEEKDRLCEAQNHRCPLCGKRMEHNGNRLDAPTIEHIKPLFRGGADDLDNVAITCVGCNGARDPYVSLLVVSA
jgi:5-methylcytosine-specific restriction endonuclease McrA